MGVKTRDSNLPYSLWDSPPSQSAPARGKEFHNPGIAMAWRGRRSTPCLPSCCGSRHGDLTSLRRRLPHRINQAVQVHRRLKGGIARGDVARADRHGKARIQLANIVRRPLGHILRHVAIARGNLQRLKIPTSACPLEMDSTELRGLDRLYRAAGTQPPWPRGCPHAHRFRDDSHCQPRECSPHGPRLPLRSSIVH